MLRTSVTISCANEETARAEGADRLGVPPDDVAVASVDAATYTVALRNAPGQLEIVVLDGDMKAIIRKITPPLGDGKPVAVRDIEQTLAQHNVVFGINRERIEKLVSEVADSGIPQNDIPIAVGQPAKHGVNARIEFRFRLNGEDPETINAARRRGELDPSTVIKELVAEGDVLAVKIPPEEPVDGCTVTGETLPGAESRDKVLLIGANVALLDDGVTFVAKGVTAGYADVEDGTLRVENPLQVSHDKLSVHLSVHPPSRSNRMLTMEMIEKMLSDAGITRGVDRHAIEQAVNQAAANGIPILETLIAQGKAPRPGEDAQIQFNFQTEKAVGTVDQKSGVIDYKERQTLQNVKAGQILAIKTPATDGEDGVSVYGEVIPAQPGADKILAPGENVTISDDDGLVLTSTIDGVAVLTHQNKVAVAKQFKVAGDVDYSTGNLSMDGSLDINGWIRAGFHVKAKNDIRVGGGIEDAYVEAGGHIYVKGGIIGSREGEVRADGDITVRFIETGRVHATGDIFINSDIVRSHVSAEGSIIDASGRSRIRGGSVNAGKVIDICEIGSPAGILTQVSVGVAPEVRERFADLSKRLAEYRKNKLKLNIALSKYDGAGKDKTIPSGLLRKLETLREHRRVMVMEEKRIAKERDALAKKLAVSDSPRLAVRVKGIVYAGTTVLINGYVFKVTDDMEGKTTFIFDDQELAVKMVR